MSLKGSLVSLVLLLTSLLLVHGEVDDADRQCDRKLERLLAREKSTSSLEVEKNLPGLWTSSQCEVRSGPKFLVRQYLFADNSTFLARQFHYSDRECRSPLYSITASGSVIASGHLVASNGANMMFLPTRKSSWQGYTEEAKRACSEDDSRCAFEFSELREARIDLMQSVGGTRHTTHLLLGDTDAKKLTHYPLLRSSQTRGCQTCQRVSHASSASPPRLRRRPLLSGGQPEGKWISRRCEEEEGMTKSEFLAKKMTFRRNRTWQGTFRYFADKKCTHKAYTVEARGMFIRSGLSHMVDGGTDIAIKTTSAWLTVHTNALAWQLNATPVDTCASAVWRVNVPQSLAHTGGCATLGIKVPLLQQTIAKLEISSPRGRQLQLFLGRVQHKKKTKRSPTYYQPPLVQCADERVHFTGGNELTRPQSPKTAMLQSSSSANTSLISLRGVTLIFVLLMES